jgi:hypothetical protein
MIRSGRERNRSCSPVSYRSRGRVAHPPSIISRARNYSLRFKGIAKIICKKTVASPPNSGKNHYLERRNHRKRCFQATGLSGRSAYAQGRSSSMRLLGWPLILVITSLR